MSPHGHCLQPYRTHQRLPPHRPLGPGADLRSWVTVALAGPHHSWSCWRLGAVRPRLSGRHLGRRPPPPRPDAPRAQASLAQEVVRHLSQTLALTAPLSSACLWSFVPSPHPADPCALPFYSQGHRPTQRQGRLGRPQSQEAGERQTLARCATRSPVTSAPGGLEKKEGRVGFEKVVREGLTTGVLRPWRPEEEGGHHAGWCGPVRGERSLKTGPKR